MTGQWEWTTLREVLVPQPNKKPLQQGWSPKCIPSPSPDSETWGVLKTTAIQPGRFDETQNKELPATLAPRPAIEVQQGDLLMTCAGPRSRCGIPALVRSTRPRLMMSGKMYRFRPVEGVDSAFLEKWLLSAEAQARIDAMKTGISDSGLNLTQDRFLALPVPVPEISEQRRIVEIVEEFFSRIESAENGLRSSGVRAAASVTSWLHHRLRSEGYSSSALGTFVESIRGGWSRSRRHVVDASDGVPYLKMNNITSSGAFDLSEMVHVGASEDDLAKYSIRHGDLLFNSKNSFDLVGKSAVVDASLEGAVFNENIMRIRLDENLLPGFLRLWLLSPEGRRTIQGAASASTNVSAVYQSQILKMTIPVPTVPDQAYIIEEFDGLQSSIGVLSGELSKQAFHARALRRAILTAAFAGRLTGRSTDAEVIEELAASR